MGYEKLKTEHAGAKNGGGAWTTRAEAKRASNRGRRVEDQRVTRDQDEIDEAITAGYPAHPERQRATRRIQSGSVQLAKS